MRMKKGLLMVVFLLAISSVMAAMSFSSASVTSGMSVSVVDTEDALLALDASDEHNASFISYTSANSLVIDLDKGNGNESYGVQEESTYTWDNLFKVTNNSEHAVDVTIKTEEVKAISNFRLYANVDEGDWAKLVGRSSKSPGGELTFTLNAGDQKEIGIKTLTNSSIQDNLHDLDFVVEAVKK